MYFEKFAPILSEYENLSEGSFEDKMKFLNVSETLIIEYGKNPNADLSLIVKTKYGKNE